MRTHLAATRGFTLVEIMIVIAIIGLLVAIAVPNFIKHREFAQTQACLKNLSTLEGAKQIWGVENRKSAPDAPNEIDLIGPTLYIKVMPVCPSGGNYNIQPIGVNATCTYNNHVL
jgi:prepilin-type N-terminal cleavage/methylation domain-containing protein